VVTWEDGPNSTTVESRFFDNEEAYDYQPWLNALIDSAPVCLRRPAVLAPSNIYFSFADQRLLMMNRIVTPRMTRGPPALMAA
jgi:hypothetical protein